MLESVEKEKVLEAYTGFASVYDEFMDDIDYEAWCDYLIRLLYEYNIKDGIIAELGCGTGNATQILAQNGYDVIGIDLSREMLGVATDKLYRDSPGESASSKQQGSVIYVCQDICNLQLPYKVNGMVSICDSMNYIVDYNDFLRVLKNVKKYLNPGGVFIFDLKTRKYFSDIGESVIAEDRVQCSFIWDNFFDAGSNVNEYRLSLFVQEEDGKYRKVVEEHYQRAYLLKEIKEAARESELVIEAIYDAFTKESISEESDRIYIILKNNE